MRERRNVATGGSLLVVAVGSLRARVKPLLVRVALQQAS